MTRGDSRIAITIARNSNTAKFSRSNRFIIDDPNSSTPLAYALTKPLKIGHTYNNKGIFKFVLQEVNTTDDDNRELGIADYYKHFPKTTIVGGQDGVVIDPENTSGGNGRRVWL